jgi:hypothetical protein
LAFLVRFVERLAVFFLAAFRVFAISIDLLRFGAQTIRCELFSPGALRKKSRRRFRNHALAGKHRLITSLARQRDRLRALDQLSSKGVKTSLLNLRWLPKNICMTTIVGARREQLEKFDLAGRKSARG